MKKIEAYLVYQIYRNEVEIYVVEGDIHEGLDVLKSILINLKPEAVNWFVSLGQGFKVMPQHGWAAVELVAELVKTLELEKVGDRYLLKG